MFSSLLLSILSIAVSQNPANSNGGNLVLSNARATYGELGKTRNKLQFLPGDIFFIAFDIDGIKPDENGNISYSLGMEVTDSDNRPIFKQPSINRTDYLALGGNRIPARAFVDIGFDTKPGKFLCKVTVKDNIGKTTATLQKEFEVIEPSFGIVRFNCLLEARPDSAPAPLVASVGQGYWMTFAVIGFKRNAISKQPKLKVTLNTKTKDGKSVLVKPFSITIDREVEERDSGVPLRFLLQMTKAGEFLIDFEVTDEEANKTDKLTIPMTIIDLKN